MDIDRQTWRSLFKEVAESSAFWKYLGMTVAEIGDGYARLEMKESENLLNAGGVLHGGALASLADSAVAIASLSVCDPQERVSTIEMKINYLMPAQPGPLTCEARIVRKGITTAVGEADILDSDGRIVAKSLMTYAVFHPDTKECISKTRNGT